MPAVRTPVDRNPRSARRKCSNVFTSSPVPVISTSATATCITTSPLCRRLCWRDSVPRPPCFIASAGFWRELSHAGSAPKTNTVKIDVMTPKIRTWPSTSASRRRGSDAGPTARRTRTPASANAMPIALATIPTMLASTSSSRSKRPRVAPSAVRTASSRSRARHRTRNRFARLARPISNTPPAAASNVSSAGRTGPTICSTSGSVAMDQPPSVCGYSPARRPLTSSRSRCAASRVTPSLSRAHTPTQCQSRWMRSLA